MLYPSIDELTKKVDSKYTLVMVTARRARQLVDGAKPKIETESAKPVTIAIEEFNQDKISYKKPNIKSVK